VLTCGFRLPLGAVWGLDSYFRAANALYFDAFGRAKAELMGASSWDFIHPVDQHRIVESVDRLITAGAVE
jgi:PAS domain-containing protein